MAEVDKIHLAHVLKICPLRHLLKKGQIVGSGGSQTNKNVYIDIPGSSKMTETKMLSY